MSHRTLAAAVALAALALPGTALAKTAATPLAGADGPGFTITLDHLGKKVTTLKPGAYKLTVRDRSTMHNFHLLGPGMNDKVTTVAFVGTKTITVTLKKGTYTYQCDPHASSGMKATFKVA